MAISRRLKEEPSFAQLCDLLEGDDSKLEDVPFRDKREFLGLFEEVALMLNSGIIRPGVAHYMFAYYAIRCAESQHFWKKNANRNSKYWALFNDFVARMKQVEDTFVFSRSKLRF